jgi:hypothetical protein
MVAHRVEHFPGKCSTICTTIRPTLNLQINTHSNKLFRAVPGQAEGRGAAGAWRGAHAGWWCVAVLHTTNLIEKCAVVLSFLYYYLFISKIEIYNKIDTYTLHTV